MKNPRAIVKAGTAFKRGSGSGLFQRHNWKPRYVVLTLNTLEYYDHQDGQLKGQIDLTACMLCDLQIMPQDCSKTGNSAATVWRLAIQTAHRRFIMAAACEKDMRSWVDAITSVLISIERKKKQRMRPYILHSTIVA